VSSLSVDEAYDVRNDLHQGADVGFVVLVGTQDDDGEYECANVVNEVFLYHQTKEVFARLPLDIFLGS